MRKLAICIPNYNRPQKLLRLLRVLADQVTCGNLYEKVEICISDDCSTERPQPVVEAVRAEYPNVPVKFVQNESNIGMDYNFLRSVMISDSEYCWIIGNDDVPERSALERVLNYIDNRKDIDILVCPFNLYDEHDKVIVSIEPIRAREEKVLYFDTSKEEEYRKLIGYVQNGNALFCFLSNVIFKKSAWIRHGNMFESKMNTIFIQMYMNLQTLKEGAVYAYIPEKLIRNYSDLQVNDTFKREYDVLVGLSGVLDYFFRGDEYRMLEECIIDPRINGRMWALPDDSPLKEPILQIDSVKNSLYKRYFIRPEHRERFFADQNILLYGAGNLGHMAVSELRNYCFRSLSIYDADPQKWGGDVEGYRIFPAEELYVEYAKRESVVVVANNVSLVEIVMMLQSKDIKNLALVN